MIDATIRQRLAKEFDIPYAVSRNGSVSASRKMDRHRMLADKVVNSTCGTIRQRLLNGNGLPTQNELLARARSAAIMEIGWLAYLLWAWKIAAWVRFIWTQFDDEL